MCGIVGFTGQQENKREQITSMNDLIAHRGPDGEGYFIDDNIALGHRRLAILDIACGIQPMISEDKEIIVIFNGEIYNFLTIREELEKLGYNFVTKNSDTEVLIHGFKEWGEKVVDKLRGMFSFAIWNTEKQELFCARDHFGIKPFYYYVTKSNNVLFGSEIKSFMCHNEFEKEINAEQLELYLSFQYSPAENTFFKGVNKLMPAHCMTWNKEKGLTIRKYWDKKLEDKVSKDLASLENDIENVMKDSVLAHKISDVEVASYLSSGIDSSFITKISEASKTFTIGYKNPKYDESVFAKEFSKEEGRENIVRYIEADEYWDNIKKVQYHMDEPLADASAISLYLLNQEASKKVKVCLSGEGADEFFGGYNVYNDVLKYKWYLSIPRPIRKIIGSTVDKMPKPKRGLNFLIRHSIDLEDRYIGCTGIFTTNEVSKILKNYKGTTKPRDLTKKYFDKNLHKVSQMQSVDINMWLVGDILLKADKMSMANSLEVRVPFLDIEVYEVARKIPVDYKCTTKETKLALRNVAKRSINNKTASKKKLGFPVPIRDWLREEKYVSKIKTAFDSDEAKQFFNHQEILSLLEDHANGKADNWRKIWCIYAFLVWYNIYFCDGFKEIA